MSFFDEDDPQPKRVVGRRAVRDERRQARIDRENEFQRRHKRETRNMFAKAAAAGVGFVVLNMIILAVAVIIVLAILRAFGVL
jgi:adenylate kinase